MNSHRRSEGAAHELIVRNLHICMRVLERFGEGQNWRIMSDIRAAGDKSLRLALDAPPDSVTYDDYGHLAEHCRRMASLVWSSMLHATSIDVVPSLVNTLDEIGYRIESESESARDEIGRFQIPNVEGRLRAMRSKLVDADEDNMTPQERLTHIRDLQSIGAGLDAASHLQAEVQERLKIGGQKVQISPLNVEFVDEAILRCWLISMAVKGALPKDSQIILDALDQVEKFHHADKTFGDQLAKRWARACPTLNESDVNGAARALLGSASSSRLDSPKVAAVDVVRSVVRATYSGMHGGEGANLANQDVNHEETYRSDLREIQPLLSSLGDQLAQLEESLTGGVTKQVINDLQSTLQRVTAKADVLLDNQQEVDMELGLSN